MDDTAPQDNTSLMKGARDIAKEAKRQAIKKVNKVVDRASDEYSHTRAYQRFQDEDDDYYSQPDGNYTGDHANDEEGSSDATEGHDDEDEIYEGEYQGIPSDAKARDGQVALGQPRADGLKDRRELENERQEDEEELAQQYELIIQECGHGRFQWQLFFTLGLALMSDGVEVFVVGFVLPSAETDMCVPDSSSGWLGSIVYLGMMVGAFFWGGMADKVGRRQCLLICMSINGFFAFLSSFVQGYGFFLLCRIIAGFGIGGAVPIVFSYFAEVLAREKRGEHLSWLCMFWMIGEIYASAMAWAIIPHYEGKGGGKELNGHGEESLGQDNDWNRLFSLLFWGAVGRLEFQYGLGLSIPQLEGVCGGVCSPLRLCRGGLNVHAGEPQVLFGGMKCLKGFFSALSFQVGKHDEAWMILKQIHDTNMRARGQPEKVFTIWLNFLKCFNYPVKDSTVRLAIVWFTLSFGYYGLSVWFPDVIKHLQADEYASKVQRHNNERIEDFTFNFTFENQIHTNSLFINDRFISMKFKSVTFINSTFQSCFFEDVTSVGSFFRNCTFIEAVFYNTDIDDSKLINTDVVNSTFYHNKTGCQMTFEDDYSAYWVYFVNFLGTLAVLPGNIVSALLMDKIGRLSMLGFSMILSGISCFFLWFGTSESMMIGMLCLYNGLSISAWNSLDVVTVELYPTDRRGTGFGFCNALCKLAAVMGNLIFGSLVGITKAIPILLASSVLVGGGLVGLRLPDTRSNVLM
ncbi:Synaptic vesicle glycoprotein 2C [Labeo rohita]|uniref:Synaptic vesicle glycoprotein 2C n=1 Tax=Labeo rohita TaxID=84645 RepID=A0ABQ8MNM2_LABRO|nr:Synaptic vesicle glycoprotein 2C [Labeo rohita]